MKRVLLIVAALFALMVLASRGAPSGPIPNFKLSPSGVGSTPGPAGGGIVAPPPREDH